MDSTPIPKSLEHLLEKRSRANRRKQERRQADVQPHEGTERRKEPRRQKSRRGKS